MNIFYLDTDPIEISKMLCDKHSVKMVLESAQMLSTAHRVLDGSSYADEHGLYRIAHKNHPSTIWTRFRNKNYLWHLSLFRAMLDEYSLRFHRTHKCSNLYDALAYLPKNIISGRFTPPPQCMPAVYKGDDAIEAYRNFYVSEKYRFAQWSYREPPRWFVKGIENH